jgi:hypothetical protein
VEGFSIEKHRRRSLNEIVTFYGQSVDGYPSLGWHAMLEFAKGTRDDERVGSLVTVGSVGSVMILWISECRGAGGHFMPRPGPTDGSTKI